MTIANTASVTTERRCPYCGNPYPYVTIPALWNIPERTIQSNYCGCRGELNAEAEWERKEDERIRKQRLKKIGIPPRFWDVPPDSTYIDSLDSPGGLFLYGDVGRGKTWTAVATTFAWLESQPWKRVVFTDAMGFFAHIRRAYDDGDSEREALWRFIGADLLIFDDFGKGRPSEWSTEKVEYVIQERYVNNRPCIFTSQWPADELVDRLAEGGSYESAKAIVSRIVQQCKMIGLDGPDRRLESRVASQ